MLCQVITLRPFLVIMICFYDPICGNFSVVLLARSLKEISRCRPTLPSVLMWALSRPFREVRCDSGSGAQASNRLFKGYDHNQILLLLDSKGFKIVLETS